MNLFGGVHHLQAELIFVQSDALDLLPVRSHHGDGFVFLGKLFGRFGESPGQPLAGIANGLDQRLNGSRRAHRGQIRSETSALPFHHVTGGTVGVAVKEFFAVGGVAERLCRRLHLHASQIRDDLPNFLVGHADALTVGSVGGHHRARNSLADVLEQFGVGVSVTLVGAREIGTTAAAARAQAVAEGAVDAEFKFASLSRLWDRAENGLWVSSA